VQALNRSKSARDPAEWLPTNISYRCQYVEDWMTVKGKWELSVDAKEFEALRGISVGVLIRAADGCLHPKDVLTSI